MQDAERGYDPEFFAGQAPGSARSARVALELMFGLLRTAGYSPGRIVDVGCGLGTWLEAALDLGAGEVTGLDGEHVARELLRIPSSCFVPADLAREGSCLTPPPRPQHYDLVLSLEVAEHLPYARSESFVAELTGLGDLVLFSAASPFQDGTGHVNEQWAEFWAILFNAQDFACFDPLRPALRASPQVAWWYAQNLLVFARRGSAAERAMPASSRADRQPLSLVHPQNLLRQTLWNYRSERSLARNLEEADFESVLAAWLRGEPKLPELSAPAGFGFPATRTRMRDPDTELRAAHAALALAEGSLREADLRLRGLQRRLEAAEAEIVGSTADVAGKD